MTVTRPVFAVDPGDRHVGLAVWRGDGESVLAREIDADRFPHFLAQECRAGRVGHLVYEEFVLYPWAATEQSWAPMLTAEMIGQIKWICTESLVGLSHQGADIKKPMRAQLRARGIRQVGEGTHARDAELHLWYYLLRNQIVNPSRKG